MSHMLGISTYYGLKMQLRLHPHDFKQWTHPGSSLRLWLHRTQMAGTELNWNHRASIHDLKFCILLVSRTHTIWVILLSLASKCDEPHLRWITVIAGFVWSCLLPLEITLPSPSINWRVSRRECDSHGTFLDSKFIAKTFSLMVIISLCFNAFFCFSTWGSPETTWGCFSV